MEAWYRRARLAGDKLFVPYGPDPPLAVPCLPAASAMAATPASPPASQHHPDHARHHPRRPHGLSRIEARTHSESRCSGSPVRGFYPRLFPSADHHGLACHHPHRHVSAVSSGQRFSACRWPPTCPMLPTSSAHGIPHGRVHRFARSRPRARSAPGFDRGFDTYDAGFHRRAGRRSLPVHRAPRRRGGRAHAGLVNQAPKDRFFIWVHLYDAHDPYDPPNLTRPATPPRPTTARLPTRILWWAHC